MKHIKYWFSFLLLPSMMHGMDSLECQKWDGEFYNTHARPMLQAGKKHVERISFEGCYSVIDIGCGAGAITAYIADKLAHARVVGSDVSADMIRAARKHYGSRENLTFCEQDAQKNVGNREFDVAVSFLTLHWVPNKPLFFTTLFKALKPGGKFYLTAGTKKPEIEALKKKFFAALFAHDPQWQFLMGTSMVTANNAISQDEVAQHCTHAGFTDVTITQEVEHHTFDTVHELANFVGTFICGYKDIADLPADKRQAFISTAAQLWTNVCADGKPSYTWANLVVQGRKPKE